MPGHTPALGNLALASRALEAHQGLAYLDGVINLLTKAERAFAGEAPEGRQRAATLLARAERCMPDLADVEPDLREAVTVATEALRVLRTALEAGPRL